MSDVEKVIELLSKKPGLRVRQIADELGIERKSVNYILDGPLRHKVVQDNSYRWRLTSLPNQTAQPQPKKQPEPSDPLARLVRYYVDCLTHDATGVRVCAASKDGDLKYAELPQFPLLENSVIDLSQVEGIHTLIRKIGRDSKRKTGFLGYPIRIHRLRSRKGWSYMVDPVMLFPMRRSFLPGSLELSFEEMPFLNFAHLRSFPNVDSGDMMHEAIQLADELGLSNGPDQLPDLDELFLRLLTIRPDWDWQEGPDVYELSSGPKVSEITETGIYNRAIFCEAERSQYTSGLETELGRLGELSEDAYSDTALGAWLSGRVARKEHVEESEPPLLQAVPLNLEQRTAIERSFSNPLTVITGPPGTGKSQVVTALLMNAAWQGKKVLFASKNNKAVDVVGERVNALGTRPLLLRFGTSEHRRELVEYLSSLLGARAAPDDEANYHHHLDVHGQLLEKMKSQQLLLDQLVAARNQVDHIEQQIEDLRGIFSEENFQRIRDLPIEKIDESLSAFSKAVDGANRRLQTTLHKLSWRFIRNSRYARLAEVAQQFKNVQTVLGISSPTQLPNDETILQWIEFRDRATERCNSAHRIDEYFKSLAMLQECEPAEVVAKSTLELNNAIAENSMQLWQYWLHIQPNRLSHEERRLLGDYSALLQLIVKADEENRQASRDVIRRYHQLSQKMADLLPCWAVTSLSARNRIPLEPGIFDLVVIDEASQCDIASALPLLYRAKHAVIIGDPQQLRHISSISPSLDGQLLAAHNPAMDYASWAYSAHSLFDLASSLCRSEDIVALRDHHRSHSDIITFSNDQFYEGRLRVATDYNKLNMVSRDGTAIRLIDLRGHVSRPPAGGAVNEDEAQAVVRELRKLVSERNYPGTIGVVSPFRAQANRIREIIFQDGTLTQKLNSTDSEFMVDTVHRFQGDERDLIIFSPVVSRNISENALNFLRHNGNLFNVAITRARSALVVIGDRATAASCKVDYLERFSMYVDDMIEAPRDESNEEIRELGPVYPTVSRPERVSDWERKFYKALFSAGHRPIPQYSVDQYDLDFALFAGQDRRLDIEVDGERYHRDWDGELCRRDQIRNQRLMELGWDVMRFWVYEIRDDLYNCVSRVNTWVARDHSLEAS